MFASLRKFDWMGKTQDEYKVQTYAGAALSIASGIFIITLMASEFAYYLRTDRSDTLMVDSTRHERMDISLDVVFHRLPCAYVSVDVMDISGEQQHDVTHQIWKKALDADGKPLGTTVREEELRTPDPKELLPPPKEEGSDAADDDKPWLKPGYCGSCWGAEATKEQCCNTCEDVREAYRRKGWAFANADKIEQCEREGWSDKMKGAAKRGEGCSVYGTLSVNKVAGNFHFAPGKSFQQQHMHVHDLHPFQGQMLNLSHAINSLSFGPKMPDARNPLDGLSRRADGPNAMYQYFIKIVPAIYERLDGSAIASNQYSVTAHYREVDHSKGQHGLPGVFFMYDFSPMMVRRREEKRALTHFLTGVCAIVGGVFTVTGMIDAFCFHSYKTIRAKIAMGKQS